MEYKKNVENAKFIVSTGLNIFIACMINASREWSICCFYIIGFIILFASFAWGGCIYQRH